jgi:hypothetical protein
MNIAIRRAGLSVAALLAAAVSLQAMASPMKLPPDRTVGIASYTSGGIGDGQAARFKAAFDRYPLAIELLEHAGSRDEYTADAHVKIVDHEGKKVLDERADGPFMLVRLPAGEYRVTASLKGHELSAHHVRLTSGGHERTAFVWPQKVG